MFKVATIKDSKGKTHYGLDLDGSEAKELFSTAELEAAKKAAVLAGLRQQRGKEIDVIRDEEITKPLPIKLATGVDVKLKLTGNSWKNLTEILTSAIGAKQDGVEGKWQLPFSDIEGKGFVMTSADAKTIRVAMGVRKGPTMTKAEIMVGKLAGLTVDQLKKYDARAAWDAIK